MPLHPILGIDPSISSTGVALLDESGYRTWTIITNAERTEPQRVNELARDVTELLRYESPLPCLAVVERGFSGGHGPSAIVNGMAAGALLVAVWHAGVPPLMVAPKTRAKFATGNGNADKLDVRDAARKRLGFDSKAFDEIDALWLAVMGAAMLGWYPYALPQSHIEVIEQYRERAKATAYNGGQRNVG